MSEGTRTPDRLDHNQELYQLSYAHRGTAESTSAVTASASSTARKAAARPRMPGMSAANHQLVIAIDERLAEARRQIAALESARAQMNSDPVRPHRTATPARARTARQPPAPTDESVTPGSQATASARPRTTRQTPGPASPRRTASSDGLGRRA